MDSKGASMKLSMLSLALFLSAAPVFAQQQADESTVRETGVFGLYALGNLAIQDYRAGNEPVEQMKKFFIEAQQPLSTTQTDQLKLIVQDQVKAIQASGQTEDEMRRLNREYSSKVSDALTPSQRITLRRYRTEQIMLRGGLPALKTILEDAQVPFTPDQEAKAQALYLDFHRQASQLAADSKNPAAQTDLYKLATQSLGQVVRLLTPEQRRALAASRRGTLSARVTP
jgi:hypothetical protein